MVSDVLLGQDAFDAALDRLRAGDRRCFDFLGARGHFSEGLLQVEWWQDMFVRQDRFAPSASPRWREIGEAMHDCLAARLDVALVLQNRSIDAPAPIGRVNLFMSSPFSSLMKWWLGRTQLPAVPSANPEVLVATGQVVPCHGVWEPVQVTPTGLGTVSGRRPASPPPDRPLDGCMNYLHGGSAAPTIQFEGDGPRGEGRPTTWRLIWQDDRYGTRPVPPHEANYVFIRPVKGEVVCTCW